MATEGVVVGIRGGLLDPSHHGDLQQRKRRFGFSKKKPNFSKKNSISLKKE
jgi:hypothetical protein